MPTSKADRLKRLFEKDSLPPPPDPNTSHIADIEIISKMQPAQQPWKVPRVAQTPRKVHKSPPRTGRDLDQLTSSDDDEYISAFKKTPAIKSEITSKAKKSSSTLASYQHGTRPMAKARPQADSAAAGRTEVGDGKDDGVSNIDKDGHLLNGRFCPLALVTKFCYKYMDDPNDRVSRHFFASGKIWNRTWDIYYIYPPASMFGRPILLVPEGQVQTLLDEINSAFRTSIKLPGDPFLLAFYEDGTPSPTLLGISQSREAVAQMEPQIGSPSEDYGECPLNASPELERSFERFKKKMERVTAAQKKKGVAIKKATAKDRLTARVNWVEALKRGQRYLGLRPTDRKGGLPPPDPGLSWDEQQRFEREQKVKHGHILEPLEVGKLAPQRFDRDVVFISVDVEAFERAQNLVTEVGISTLDTADIKCLAPGEGGNNWMECVRSRHFRISNHQHLRNTTFCPGDPEKFLFGRSEFVSMNRIGKMVDSCFEPPYSAHFAQGGKLRAEGESNSSSAQIEDQLESISLNAQQSGKGGLPVSQFSSDPINVEGPSNAEQDLANKVAVSNILPPSAIPPDANVTLAVSERQRRSPPDEATMDNQHAEDLPPSQFKSKPKPRNIILVGHNVDADLHYLSTLQSKIFSNPPVATYPQPLEPEHPFRQYILERLDTANLYQVWKREATITSLARVLVGVERTGWHLHNGGNDARYTLEALVGILVRSRLEEGNASTVAAGDGTEGGGDEKQRSELEEKRLKRTIRENQDGVAREERENAAMWRHAIGPHGSGYRAREEEVLPDPHQPQPQPRHQHHAGGTSSQLRHDHDPETPTASNAFSHAQPPPTPASAAEPYAWSSLPHASLDGGEPKGFAMPAPKGEKVKPSTRRREEVVKVQGEGKIGRPCDGGVGGGDGW